VKRRAPVRHLEEHGCRSVREGGRHTVYANPTTKRSSAVPRHAEINDYLARKICRDLGVPEPA
jgi:mRNA interferase HicA